MTDATKRDMLKDMTGEADRDVLTTYLKIAAGIVLRKRFPFGTTEKMVPEEYGEVQVEIAAFLLNKRGAEGESSHTENGITRRYDDGDIPPGLLRRITPKGEVL